MVKILLITANKKEGEILTLAFQQKAFKVILSEPSYSNYVKSIQYMPDVLLMEIPATYTDQLHFIRLLKKNKRLNKIPVMSYGLISDQNTIKLLFLTGANKFYQRPLKFGELLNDMAGFLKGKVVAVANKDENDSVKRAEMVSFLLNPEKVGSEKTDLMAEYIGKLLVFPFTVNRILKIADDIKSGAPELAKVIKTDAAMTTTILKVANSVLFASRDRKVSEIREAVVRIGFRETKNVALSMSVMKLFAKEEKSLGYNRMEFWYHSLAVAVLAERFARQAGLQGTEEAFVAGLLHDFGILLLDEFFPEIFDPVMAETTKNGTGFDIAVKKTIGISHNEVVERLFQSWNIPKRIVNTVLHQMNYLNFKDEVDPDQQKLVGIIGMSNILAKAMDIGRECDQVVSPLSNELLVQFRFATGLRGAFFDEIHGGINMYARFLNLDGRSFPEARPLESANTKLKIMIVNRSGKLFDPHIHYITHLGYIVQPETALTTIINGDELPNLIIMNTDADTPVTEVSEFLGNSTIPVLLFYSLETPCAALQTSPNVHKLLPTIDLRNIDMAMEACLKPKA